jgi:hypothetical protein
VLDTRQLADGKSETATVPSCASKGARPCWQIMRSPGCIAFGADGQRLALEILRDQPPPPELTTSAACRVLPSP